MDDIIRDKDGALDTRRLAERIAELEIRSSLTAEEAFKTLSLAALLKDRGFNAVDVLRKYRVDDEVMDMFQDLIHITMTVVSILKDAKAKNPGEPPAITVGDERYIQKTLEGLQLKIWRNRR